MYKIIAIKEQKIISLWFLHKNRKTANLIYPAIDGTLGPLKGVGKGSQTVLRGAKQQVFTDAQAVVQCEKSLNTSNL